MSAPIEVGACYRDPYDGQVRRVTALYGDDELDACVPGDGHTVRWLTRSFASCYCDRVADPTPAVVDDESAHDEAARQERVDATARAVFSTEDAGGADAAYQRAESLEAARERYIAGRKGGAK